MAVRRAQDFVWKVPADIPLPEFAPEPDGSVCLDWIQSRRRLFVLSIGRTNRLAYAWVDGEDKGHGVVRFDGSNIPTQVLQGIRSVTGPGNGPRDYELHKAQQLELANQIAKASELVLL